MSEETAIATTAPMQMAPNLTSQDVSNQVKLVQDVMSRVMQDGTHYGKIPGCGNKPTLLQPGAQVLNLTFQLAPKFLIEKEELDHGHREYIVTCNLHSKVTGQLVGSGAGSCSTMEKKYRYRKGGSENPDIADVYNTVLKMAMKRALVHATLNTTAASDMFTQDVEDMGFAETPAPAPAPVQALVAHPHDYTRFTELNRIFAESMGWSRDEAGKAILRDYGDPRGMDDAQYADMISRLEAQMTASGMLEKPAPESSTDAPPADPSLYEEVPF